MPPRQNETILGPLDIQYEPVTVYRNNETGLYTDGDRLFVNDTVTRATLNTDGFTWNTAYLDDRCVTREELSNQLDAILQKIYKVITDHTKLDITEEEFMRLIREE